MRIDIVILIFFNFFFACVSLLHRWLDIMQKNIDIRHFDFMSSAPSDVSWSLEGGVQVDYLLVVGSSGGVANGMAATSAIIVEDVAGSRWRVARLRGLLVLTGLVEVAFLHGNGGGRILG